MSHENALVHRKCFVTNVNVKVVSDAGYGIFSPQQYNPFSNVENIANADEQY